MDPYALIAQMPNAGQAFSDAFQKGQQQNALASFAQNPNPQTAGAAARYDPGAVLQYNLQSQRDQQQLSAEHQKAWHDYAGNLAKWADSPDKWDHAVDQMVSHGFPEAAQLKGKFSPELRANYMALGGVQEKQPEDPGIIREFDIATQRGLVPHGTTYEQYVAMRNPSAQQPIVLPQSYSQVSGGAPSATATGPNGEKVQYNPQSGQWEPMGGAGGNASGGFPGPAQSPR